MLFPKPKRKPRKDDEWGAVRLEKLRRHPRCEVCNVRATEVHHKAGRLGPLLTELSNLLSVCRECHARIHANPAWAYERGYLLKRNVLG